MKKEAWDFLYYFANMTSNHNIYIEQYLGFMGNPDNIHKCWKCPANKGIKEGSSHICGPCGQQNCWVRAHCGML